ncbi:MAG: GPW/gp25 family protein [Anaerolineae bacterium]
MSNSLIGNGLSFPLHFDQTGGLSLTGDRTELEQSIMIILGTSPGERVMRPKFGCRLQEVLFMQNNQQTASIATYMVEDALAMWEPRIMVTQVTAKPNPNDGACMLIEIEYEVKATNDRRSLVYPFYVIPEDERTPAGMQLAINF